MSERNSRDLDILIHMQAYFLRIGSLAEVRVGLGDERLERGRRVIVRTSRGLELAEVVKQSQQAAAEAVSIIRSTTEQDELLIRRLERHKREAVEACRKGLTESGSTAVLLDVDQLFDGGTLVMHFLGKVDAIAEAVTKEVVHRYESIARTRHFAKLLQDGCGPDCGTKEKGGCGTSCAGCAIACRT